MAEIKVKVEEGTQGGLKKMDKNAIDLLMQNMQVDIYKYPIKSFIRETVSNCVDSIKEASIARKIIVDGEPVSKYYSDSDDKLAKASKFSKDYYNFDHISDEPKVIIDYLRWDTIKTDYIKIKDQGGVGIWGSRIEGYLDLGWSSKRLSKALGCFGVGGKSPLAVADSFRSTIVYEGKRIILDITLKGYNSVVPAVNSEGEFNKFITWKSIRLDSEGKEEEYDFKAYYEPCDECNGVEIGVAINKSSTFYKVEEAIKDQLGYLDVVIEYNVHYYDWGSNIDVEDVRIGKLYEDDTLVVSNSLYTKPFILLNNINYGIVDFEELGWSTTYAAVGLKIDPSLVDVNQSRESVKYTPKTIEVIKASLAKAKELAKKYIKEDTVVSSINLLEWYVATVKARGANVNEMSTDMKIYVALKGLLDTTKAAKRSIECDDVTLSLDDMELYFKLSFCTMTSIVSDRIFNSNVIHKNDVLINALPMVYIDTPIDPFIKRYLIETDDDYANGFIMINQTKFDSVERTDVIRTIHKTLLKEKSFRKLSELLDGKEEDIKEHFRKPKRAKREGSASVVAYNMQEEVYEPIEVIFKDPTTIVYCLANTTTSDIVSAFCTYFNARFYRVSKANAKHFKDCMQLPQYLTSTHDNGQLISMQDISWGNFNTCIAKHLGLNVQRLLNIRGAYSNYNFEGFDDLEKLSAFSPATYSAVGKYMLAIYNLYSTCTMDTDCSKKALKLLGNARAKPVPMQDMDTTLRLAKLLKRLEPAINLLSMCSGIDDAGEELAKVFPKLLISTNK